MESRTPRETREAGRAAGKCTGTDVSFPEADLPLSPKLSHMSQSHDGVDAPSSSSQTCGGGHVNVNVNVKS